MSVFESQDWDQVLQPLPGEQPCGVDMQYDASYDSIRRARQDQTDSLPAGVWERQTKKIDWESVGKQCLALLTQQSKDLQVGAWMVEAFAQGSGLRGAVRAVALFSNMTMAFWADLHPRLEVDDIELRLRPLNWLLRESLKWFSGTLPDDDSDSGDVDIHQHWQALQSQFLSLEMFLNEHLADNAPNFREIHAALRARCSESAPLEQAAGLDPNAGASTDRGSLNSREAAYEQLRSIAAFLARIEPHSPVPMVLESVVAWRDVRFEDLLERLPAQGGGSVYELLKLFRQDPSR